MSWVRPFDEEDDEEAGRGSGRPPTTDPGTNGSESGPDGRGRELAEDCRPLDDSREQVGYELFDWDPTRLDLLDDQVHVLGIPHEWVSGGYELVVHTADEAAVDLLISQTRSPHELAVSDGPPPAHETPGSVMGQLFTAAGRLKSRPFDAVSVSGLAAAAAAMEIDPPYGVDAQTWAFVGAKVDSLLDLLDRRQDPDAVRAESEALWDVLRPIV